MTAAVAVPAGVAAGPRPAAVTDAAPPVIVLSHVGVTYVRGEVEVEALTDVSLCVPPGDFVFLVGSTGAGKSTLLKLLYREVRATSGTVIVNGRDVTALRSREIPALRRQMGIVLQDYGLLLDRTVWDNVAFACQVIGMPRREARKRVGSVLDAVGMAPRCDAYPGELSGGEQQRVAIARALVNNPPLLLADEPTGNLDPDTAQGILDVLLQANRRGTTVVTATHDKASVDRLRRRVVAIERGTVSRDDAHGTYGYDAG